MFGMPRLVATKEQTDGVDNRSLHVLHRWMASSKVGFEALSSPSVIAISTFLGGVADRSICRRRDCEGVGSGWEAALCARRPPAKTQANRNIEKTRKDTIQEKT